MEGYDSPAYWDMVHTLPSGKMVPYCEIAKAFNGDDFVYFESKDAKEGTRCEGIPPDVAFDWFEYFQNWKLHGLPHGRGWLDESPQSLAVYREFQGVCNAREEYEMKRKSP